MSDPSEPSEKPDPEGPSAESSPPSAPEPDSLVGPPPSGDPPSLLVKAQPPTGIPSEPPPPGGSESELPVVEAEARPLVPAAPVELTHEQIELIHKRRRDKTIGLVIITVTFVVSMMGSLYAKKLAEPEVSQPPGPPTTEGVENWPKKVDALQVLGVARLVTPRDQLRGFVAEMVKSDGTIDFSKKGRRVRYSFQSKPGHGPQPPRKAGARAERTYCGRQNVHIKDLGVVADPDMASYPCPLPGKEKEALPDPGCTIKEVWKHALEMGAPKKKLARIEYYRAEAGPAYRFNLPGTKYRFSLFGDCSRVLTGRDAIGGVP